VAIVREESVNRQFRHGCPHVARKSSLSAIVVLTVLVLVGSSAQDWNDPVRPYRVALTVASSVERVDATAEIELNFTSLLDSLGIAAPFDASSLRLTEVNAQGDIVAASVPFQFDPDSAYDPTSNAKGNVILQMTGTTRSSGERYYHLYFDLIGSAYSPPSFTPLVRIDDNITDEGLLTYRIQTPASVFFYHKEGGGLSSWVDGGGQDWIGFSTIPGSGSAGLYRGIPNAVYPEGYFHPGDTSSLSEILWQGPLKATLRSRAAGEWECVWEFYPQHARMTMTRVNHSYWLLYEGTPGGSLEPETDFMVRSDGTQKPLSESWTGDLPGEEWLYFSDPSSGPAGRSLFIALEEGDSVVDSYYPMEANMTVFGFGRNLDSGYLTDVPKRLTLGLVEGTSHASVAPRVLAAYKPIAISAGDPEERPLPAPDPVMPPPGVQGVSDPLTFAWRSVGGATGYEFEVATDSLFGVGLVVRDSLLVDTVRIVTGLEQGRLHFWRIRALRETLIGPFSQPWAFSTAIPPPVPVRPLDGEMGLPLDVVFRWSGVAPGAASWIQVDDDSLFAPPMVVDDSTLSDSSALLTGLQPGLHYHWRVASRKNFLNSTFSSRRRFSTAMPGPEPVDPAPDAQNQPTIVTFRWHPVQGAVVYHLQLAADSSFLGGIVKNDSTVIDTARTVIGLAEGRRYFWRVRGTTAIGKTLFSSALGFTTVLGLPAQVTPVSPPEGGAVMSDSVQFTWLASMPSVSRYWFELSADPAFMFSQIDSTGADTLKVVHGLLPGRGYWWRVRAGNATGWGPFSSARTFLVTVADVGKEEEPPQDFALEQNYPNPFNPETVLRLTLPVAAQVRLGVYALTGELIELLLDERRDGGRYEVRFDAGRLASGVYLCRMEVAGRSFVRKLVLVR